MNHKGIMEFVTELAKQSRLGGGEGLIDRQKPVTGVNLSDRSNFGHTQVDPTFGKSEEVRGVIGAIQKQLLLKRLDDLANVQEPVMVNPEKDIEFWSQGQVTPLRFIGEEGEALDYVEALRQSEGSGYSPTDIPSYRDWRRKPGNIYHGGGGGSLETRDVVDAYKKYAESPKNIFQLLLRGLGMGGKGKFKPELDYRGHSNDPRFKEGYNYGG